MSYGHASYLRQTILGRRLMEGLDEDYSPAAREEFADDDERCGGSGEIQFNKSWGKEPWNDDSVPCHGCPDCEPEDDEDAAPTPGTFSGSEESS